MCNRPHFGQKDVRCEPAFTFANHLADKTLRLSFMKALGFVALSGVAGLVVRDWYTHRYRARNPRR